MNDPNSPIVLGKDGFKGQIETERSRIGSDELIAIRLEDGQRVLVPQALLQAREDGSYFLPLSMVELQAHRKREATDDDTLVIPITAEEVSVRKRSIDTGGVRIHTTVHERTETVDEPLLHEEVTVERVAINRRLDGNAPIIRQEGDTTIIPILEEVLVVEKRLILKEELRVRRIQTTVHEQQQVTLQYEEAEVERLPASDAS